MSVFLFWNGLHNHPVAPASGSVLLNDALPRLEHSDREVAEGFELHS